MTTNQTHAQAVDLLQQLGLKEYEANCFVALSRVPKATAKEISEISDVPRTRVYDATRVLEAKGLIETQHSSPQLFRAVSVDEGLDILRHQYETRMDTLAGLLSSLDGVDTSTEETTHEVWALSESQAIANRTQTLVDGATDEIVLVVGDESIVTDDLVDSLVEATEREITVIVGTPSDAVEERIDDAIDGSDVEVFVSQLEWMDGIASGEDDAVAISRLCLIDRTNILVSSVDPTSSHERAVFGTGFSNGLVVIVRRLLATGLLRQDDPGIP